MAAARRRNRVKVTVPHELPEVVLPDGAIEHIRRAAVAAKQSTGEWISDAIVEKLDRCRKAP